MQTSPKGFSSSPITNKLLYPQTSTMASFPSLKQYIFQQPTRHDVPSPAQYLSSQTEYSEQVVRRQANRQAPVKTVSILINNLDQHISESFDSIRKRRGRGTPSSKQCPSQNQSIKEESIFKDNSSTFDNLSKLMFTSEKKPASELESLLELSKYDGTHSNPITLIDNAEVNEYIHFVYETYNIPNPLEEVEARRGEGGRGEEGRDVRGQGQKINIRTSRRTLTGTPVLRKKNSASSFKQKIVKQRQIDLMPFHSTRKEEKETEVDISLLSSYQSKQKVEEKRGKTVKLKQINAIPQTNAKIQLKTPSTAVSYTSQTFRYCFACESTVLEANLRHHEKQCKPLQQAMTKSIEEITAMLDQKINALTHEIQTEFVEPQEDHFLTEYRNLKQSVGEWISNIKQVDKENYQTNSARSKMSQIQENWGRTISQRFEVMAKLHWFSRLRQNLKGSLRL